MFDLFRFVVLRPPEADSGRTIPLVADSEFAAQLRIAREAEDPRPAIKQVADDFLQSEDFVREAGSLAHAQALAALHNRLAASDSTDLETLRRAVRAAFNRSPAELIASAELQAERRRLHDSLLAAKISQPPDLTIVAQLVRDVRLIALIERIAAGDTTLEEPDGLAEALGHVILLPPDLFPLPRSTTPARPDGDDRTGEEAALVRRYEHLQSAYRLLTELEPEDIAIKHARVASEYEESGREPTEIEQEIRRAASILVRREAERLAESDTLDVHAKVDSMQHLLEFVAGERIADGDGRSAPLLQTELLQVARLAVQPAAAERFSAEVREVLADIEVHLEATSLPQAVDRIKAELTRLTPEVLTALQSKAALLASNANVVAVGGQLFPAPALPDGQQPLQGLPGPAPVLPTTRGTVEPVGVGDLLVVRQQLVGYERDEVAYIENVLEGEIHKRVVRRSETIEESTLTEQESARSEERDLQSTERFELQRESENVLALDGRIRGDGRTSPSYGPVVEFENDDEKPLRGSQKIAERTASTFSRDVTSRAASRVTERARSQATRRVVRQFEESSERTHDNHSGNGPVVGVYQWITKLYQAQVFYYGKRLFYDLVVPEPAAFLVQAFARSQAEGRGLTKPDALTVPLKDGTQRPLQPDDLTDTNYAYYVARYEATGVKAPPDAYIIISKILVGDPAPKPQNLELFPPEGYERATRMHSVFYSVEGAFKGKTATVFEQPTTLDLTLSKGQHWRADLGCRRKASLFKQWQLNTYEAILRAFRKQMDDYEERLANVQAALRVGSLGFNAQHKRALERNELKKACITLFTHQHFDIFNGIDAPGSQPVLYPQLNLTNAEPQGLYIRFFEQAFEWEQMMYNFYPYFWGRKDQWAHKATLEDRDPQFAEFLRAGAARTLVPVRPGFEKAIVHFMETGEVWSGGELPEVHAPTYLPLLEEVKAAATAPSAGVPYGEPWEVRLPTTLVMLREDGKLPRWHEENGRWVPEA